ncbi:MAG: AraD1 family protein [Pirellulales bacterium]
MRVVQFYLPDSGRRLGLVLGDQVLDVTAVAPELTSTYAAFQEAERTGTTLVELLRSRSAGAPTLAYYGLLTAARSLELPHLLPPLDHPDLYREFVTGTGLTHLGSMQSRNAMHASDAPLTDSAKMFQLGIDGGKPAAGEIGAAPEWFYKGTGHIVRGPGDFLDVPDFARDGGEEPELVACYIVGAEGTPVRLGWALGNEWSDHPTEKLNYLYLAPSKLRTCAVGPELILGGEFDEIELRCTVVRGQSLIYDSGLLYSGERHMCHSLANLEDHHFKYPEHRRPGDVHLHFLGTSKLSYGQRDWEYQTGDVVRVESRDFSAPLVNFVRREPPRSSPIVVDR